MLTAVVHREPLRADLGREMLPEISVYSCQIQIPEGKIQNTVSLVV